MFYSDYFLESEKQRQSPFQPATGERRREYRLNAHHRRHIITIAIDAYSLIDDIINTHSNTTNRMFPVATETKRFT
jgi:hypothetical protein